MKESDKQASPPRESRTLSRVALGALCLLVLVYFGLQLRDRTRLPVDLWKRREEDTLTGLFLREMWQLCRQEEDSQVCQLAARFGLAALEKGEDVAP